MKTKMIGMNTCPQSYFHIKLPTKLELFQLVYGLHTLLPTKYLLPSKLGENKDPQHVRVLISQLSKLEKLKENKLIA
jgi:hypothetical protein